MTYNDLKNMKERLDNLEDELKLIRSDLEQSWENLLAGVKDIVSDLEKGLRDLRPQDDQGKRRSLYPELGDILKHISGGSYCVTGVSLDSAVLCSLVTGWTMTVHDLGIYDSGEVDWSHSTGGHFDLQLLKKIVEERL